MQRTVWDETRGGLALLFWSWLGVAAMGAIQALYTTYALQGMGPGESEFRTFQIISMALEVVELAGWALVLVGVVRLLRIPADARVTQLIPPVLACVAIVVLGEIFSLVLYVAQLAGSGRGLRWLTPGVYRWIWVVIATAGTTGTILLLLVFYGLAKRIEALLPFWFGITTACCVGFQWLIAVMRALRGEHFLSEWRHPWMWMFLRIGLDAGTAVPFLLLLGNLRRTLDHATGAVPAPREGAVGWFGSPAWQRPTRGVGLYAGALKARLLVLVFGYGAVLMAALLKLPAIAALAVVGLTIGAFVTDLIMLIGQAGFASVPPESGARELATAALVANALALLVSIGAVVAYVGFFTSRNEYASVAERQMARIQLLEGGGQALAITGVMLLLVAFSRVARLIGAHQLAQKATPTLIMLALTGAGVLLLRWFMSKPRMQEAAVGVLALGVGVLFLALTSLLMYLSFVSRLHANLVEGPVEAPPDQEAPPDWV